MIYKFLGLQYGLEEYDECLATMGELKTVLHRYIKDNSALLSQAPYFVKKSRDIHLRLLEEHPDKINMQDYWSKGEAETLENILKITMGASAENYCINHQNNETMKGFFSHRKEKNMYLIDKISYKNILAWIGIEIFGAMTGIFGYDMAKNGPPCGRTMWHPEDVFGTIAILGLACLCTIMPFSMAYIEFIHKNPMKSLSEDLNASMKYINDKMKLLY